MILSVQLNQPWLVSVAGKHGVVPSERYAALMTMDKNGLSCIGDSDLVLTVFNPIYNIVSLGPQSDSIQIVNTSWTIPVINDSLSATTICMAVDVAENPVPGPRIYPSPAHDHFTVEYASEVESACLIDMNGKAVRQISPNSSSFRMQIEGISPGLYFLQLCSSGIITTSKVIISD